MAGRPSKFVAPIRDAIIEALELGLPRHMAAVHAGIGSTTLDRWVAKGKALPEDSTSGYRQFYDRMLKAEGELGFQGLRIIAREMNTKPELAKWVVERTIPKFAPPQPNPPAPAVAPVLIQLNLSDGSPVALASTAIEVGAIAQDEATAEDRTNPAPLASA